ncbi:MAG: class I SAM-dependent methyltransferase [Pseudomonadota bacterium]
MDEDYSNGYEAIAKEFMAVRSNAGRSVVQDWAATVKPDGAVIDIGAGCGEPLTSALTEAELAVCAIDASPTMVAAFQRRFPEIEIACEAAERSEFFGRTFDAALAVGLIFLLRENTQRELVPRIAKALKPGGKLLFSAPRQACAWNDILTGRRSLSLGAEEYRRILADVGLKICREFADEGRTYYYEAKKEHD